MLQDSVARDSKTWKKMAADPTAATILCAVYDRLREDSFDSADRLQRAVLAAGDELADRMQRKVKSQPPVRAAITGTSAGLPLWEPMLLLGKEKVLDRLLSALHYLQRNT